MIIVAYSFLTMTRPSVVVTFTTMRSCVVICIVDGNAGIRRRRLPGRKTLIRIIFQRQESLLFKFVQF